MSSDKTPKSDVEKDSIVPATKNGSNRTVPKKTCPGVDDIFIGLWVADVISVIVFLAKYGSGMESASGDIFEFFSELLVMVGVLCVAALIFAMAYIFALKVATKATVYVSLAAAPVFLILIGVTYMILLGGDGILFLIVFCLAAAIVTLVLFMFRKRLPFAIAMIKAVAGLVGRYPAMYGIAVFGIVCQIAFGILVLFSFIYTIFVGHWVTEDFTETWQISVLCFYFIFSYVWTSKVISNVVVVATGGNFAAWYHSHGQRTVNPTGAGLKRALTTSFGTVCCGAFVATLLAFLIALFNICIGYPLYCFCRPIQRTIKKLVRKMNIYIFAVTAIHGAGYGRGLEEVAYVFRDHAFDLVANETFASTTLTMGSVFGGLLTGMISAIWVSSSITVSGDLKLLLVFVGFLYGYLIGKSVSSKGLALIESGIAVVFVCYAQDPDVLKDTDGELYAALQSEQRDLVELHPEGSA